MAQPHVWPLALADARYVPIWEYILWCGACAVERSEGPEAARARRPMTALSCINI